MSSRQAAIRMCLTRPPRISCNIVLIIGAQTALFAIEDATALAATTSSATSPWLSLALGLIIVLQGAMIWVLFVQNHRQRKTSAEIRQQRAEIAHAARLTMMGELSASIAHEVSQPLGAILSNAEAAEMLLKQNPINLEEVQKILHDIRHDDLRAHEIISHLRSLLQKRELQLEPVDINEVAEHVQHLVERDAARRKIDIRIALAPTLPTVAADQIHLTQVLLNLILNAMDAIDKHSSSDRVVEVRTHRADTKHVEVLVTDSGPGFSPSVLPKLFNPFMSTKPNGMGLGLSIARTIIQAHGGSIWAENGANGGGVVGFAIPTRGDR